MAQILASAVVDAGSPGSSWDSNTLESFFRSVVFPKTGKTFLYGPASDVQSFFCAEAKRKGTEVTFADVVIDIEKWSAKSVDLAELAGLRFLNVHRVTDDMRAVLSEFWLANLGESRLVSDSWPRGATAHPQLIDELHADPRFSHLAAIAYSIKTRELGSLFVVTVFNKEFISH